MGPEGPHFWPNFELFKVQKTAFFRSFSSFEKMSPLKMGPQKGPRGLTRTPKGPGHFILKIFNFQNQN